MERWTFLIIPDERGEAKQIRMFLRAGDDPERYPRLQVALDGTEVPVDAVDHDYEAPEWKAIQIMQAGGAPQQRWEDLKDKLRAQV